MDLVYQTAEQLRNMPLLGLEEPPAVYPVPLSGIERNADGLFAEEDVKNKLSEAIAEYDSLKKLYTAK